MAYTPEDIQNALAQNLISEQDAQYLMGALEPQGSALGAAGGALAGAALGGAGGKLAKHGFGALAGRETPGMMQDVGKWGMQKMPNEVGGMGMPGMIADRSKGAMALGGGLGSMGAVGGGMAGSAMAGGPELGGEEVNALIAALMDPQTPKKDKAMIMEYLQSQGGMSEEQGGEGGMPWGAMVGGPIGGAVLGMVGSAIGQRLGSKIGRGENPDAFIGPTADSFMNKGLPGGGLGMNMTRAGGTGALGGATLGGVTGTMSGDMMFPASNYQDPLA